MASPPGGSCVGCQYADRTLQLWSVQTEAQLKRQLKRRQTKRRREGAEGALRYFRSIGEPEVGALLTCGVDFAVERRLRPEWEFRRTQTRMQGAPFCDFRWRRRAKGTERDRPSKPE